MCEISCALVGRALIPAGTYEICTGPPRPIHVEMRGRVHRSPISPKRASHPLSNTANSPNICTAHLRLQLEAEVPCRPRWRRKTSVRHNGGGFYLLRLQKISSHWFTEKWRSNEFQPQQSCVLVVVFKAKVESSTRWCQLSQSVWGNFRRRRSM